LTSLPAQLVEHRTGIMQVTGLNPVEALIFFHASSFQLLKLEIYRDDHSLLSSYLTSLANGPKITNRGMNCTPGLNLIQGRQSRLNPMKFSNNFGIRHSGTTNFN